jgi:hypothetical protein
MSYLLLESSAGWLPATRHSPKQVWGIRLDAGVRPPFASHDPPRVCPLSGWRTSLTNHASQIPAANFFIVPTATYRLVFVLVILAHERGVSYTVGMTEYPAAAWTIA